MCVARRSAPARRHSKCAAAPSRTGAPPNPGRQATLASLSCAPEAKSRATSRCSAARTFTAKAPAASAALHVRDVRARHTTTCGGSTESEAKELTVAPCGPVGAWAVTTVTPVANVPHAARKSAASGVWWGSVPVPASSAIRNPPLRRGVPRIVVFLLVSVYAVLSPVANSLLLGLITECHDHWRGSPHSAG